MLWGIVIVVFFAFGIWALYEEGVNEKNDFKKNSAIFLFIFTGGLGVSFIIGTVKRNSYEIKTFFYTILSWLFWGVVIVVALFVIIAITKRVIKAKEEKELEKSLLELKELEELQRLEQEVTKKLELEAIQELEQEARNELYQEKIQELEMLQQKNQQTSQEIEDLKRIVSGLSIFDDDFLEQQPRVLEYIDDVIHKGRA